MPETSTSAAWRAAHAKRLQRLHPDQPSALTAGEALALIEDVAIVEARVAARAAHFRALVEAAFAGTDGRDAPAAHETGTGGPHA